MPPLDLAHLLLLGSLAFILVTLVLYVLAHQLHVATSRHDLIREARLQRQAYLQSLADRRREMNVDYQPEHDGFNVDVVDDQADAPAPPPPPAPLAFENTPPATKAA